MRSTYALPMLLAGSAGCLDLNALQSGNSTGVVDLAMTAPPPDLSVVDMTAAKDFTAPPPDMTPTHWTTVYNNNSVPLNGLSGVSSGGNLNIYAVGTGGTVITSTDGTNFTVVANKTGGFNTLNAVWAASAKTVFVVDSGKQVFSTTDAGATLWKPETLAAPSKSLNTIIGHSATELLTAGGDKNLGRHLNGTNWADAPMNPNQSSFGSTATAAKYYVVGNGGAISYALTADVETTGKWTNVTINGGPNLNAVWVTPDDKTLYAAGDSAVIVQYDLSAKNTVSNKSYGSTGNNFHAMWAASNTDIFAVGDAATVYHYDGLAWSPYGGNGTNLNGWDLTGIWGDANGVWVCGTDSATAKKGIIFKY
jgi:hypothetical protein